MRRAAALIDPGILLAAFVLDRATKYWAQTWLYERENVAVLPFFHFTYVQNTGAAWGVMRGNNYLLIGISIVLLGALFWMRRSWKNPDVWIRYGSLSVGAGALGNLYDRIFYGYVVDFLDFLVWPVFNVADSCITVGACALAWGLHKADRLKEKEAAASLKS
ncbi:MAG: signal peptidase II [Elusimicrobia bacterium]|nr:MAG: signal peptidase II [Elusimicrobiota bacterium]